MILSKSEKRDVRKLVIIMILSSLPELLSYYSGAGIIPFGPLRLSMILSFLILNYVSLNNISKPGYMIFVCIFVWMYVVSLLHLTPTMPYLTVFSISILMVGGVLSKELSLKIILEAFSFLAVIYTVLIIWQMAKAGLDMEIILRRGYAWTEIFAYATLSGIWPICLFAAYVERRHVGIAIIITIMAIIINAISLKRAIIVEVGIAAAIIGWVSYKTKDFKTFRYIIWIGIPLAFIGISYVLNSAVGDNVNQISDAISERFSDDYEDMGSFDRYVESTKYFSSEANILDIIGGAGFFSAHHSLEEEHYFLHIGWTNFIFKGGLFLFFAILFAEFRAWRIFFHPSKYEKEAVFAMMYSILSFFLFFFGNCMAFGPRLFFIFYCLMRVNDATRKKMIQ